MCSRKDMNSLIIRDRILLKNPAVEALLWATVAILYSSSFASAATESFQCPEYCLCISGTGQASKVGNMFLEQTISEEWNRFQNAVVIESTVMHLCRNARLSSVNEDMISAADALFMDGNQIKSLDRIEISGGNRDTQQSMIPTTMLSFANNDIENITVDFLRRLPRLRVFILSRNVLVHMDWTKGRPSLFPELLELDLSGNVLRTLTPEDIGEFPSLTRLLLSGNTINFVDGSALLKFPKLEYLDLSSNQIKEQSLHIDAVEFPTIRYLSLSDNFIHNFCRDEMFNLFRAVPSLKSLDLSRNNVISQNIPQKTFSAFQYLEKLNLSSCNIRLFSDGWLNGGPNATLKILDISKNQISSISRKYLSALVDDDFSTNDIYDSEDREFRGHPKYQDFRSLEVLYLHDNYFLSKIEDDAFEYTPNVRLLFLQNCNIHRFKVATSESRLSHRPISTSLPALTNIWIFGNPIICDCNLRHLISWSDVNVQVSNNQSQAAQHLIDSSYYTTGSEEVRIQVGYATCVSPRKYSGVAIQTVPIERMTCVDDTYSIVIAMLIGPLTFAGSIALAVLCGSIHALGTKMRHKSMSTYYPRQEPARNTKRKQRWHSPPAPSAFIPPFGSEWNGSETSTRIEQHGGLQTNLVLGQFAARFHSESRNDGVTSSASHAALNQRRSHLLNPNVDYSSRQSKSLKTKSQAKRSNDDAIRHDQSTPVHGSDNIPFIDHDHTSDVESLQRARKHTYDTEQSPDHAQQPQSVSSVSQIDSRTDDTRL